MLIKTSKNLAYTETPQTTENCQKWFRVHLVEHFPTNARSFQVKKFFSKALIILLEEAQFI